MQAAIAAILAELPDGPSDGAVEAPDEPPAGPPGTAIMSKLGQALASHGLSERDLERAMRPLDERATREPARLTQREARSPRGPARLKADRELRALLEARGPSVEQFEALKKKPVKSAR